MEEEGDLRPALLLIVENRIGVGGTGDGRRKRNLARSLVQVSGELELKESSNEIVCKPPSLSLLVRSKCTMMEHPVSEGGRQWRVVAKRGRERERESKIGGGEKIDGGGDVLSDSHPT